jgi:hypothetical protein
MSGGKSRQLRRSQYISPFGVGSILDIGNESFIGCDISNWEGSSGEVIHLKRLEHRLDVSQFLSPPVIKGFWDKNPAGLPYYRFPQWLFCSSCRKLIKWNIKMEKKGEFPCCQNNKCKGKRILVPMRFVMACERGHISDVPWGYWAHTRNNVRDIGTCESHDLEFRTAPGSGGGLGSLEIYCAMCKSSRSLEGIMSDGSMRSVGVRCTGKQPWQFIPNDDNSECDGPVKVLQRGATNVYYPKTLSALDIPLGYCGPFITDQEHEIRSHGYFQLIIDKLNSSSGETTMILVKTLAQEIAESVGCDMQVVIDIATGKNKPAKASIEGAIVNEADILSEEWPILVNPPLDSQNDDVFIATPKSINGLKNTFGLDGLIDKLVLVTRLREVRVLRGFHRVIPRGDDENLQRVDLGKNIPWLPGIEVFGEGIFISFSKEVIKAWEVKNKDAIRKRIDVIKESYEACDLSFLTEPTPRFVMLHTLSHLLMRQLSFECGYSAASLRERIYSSESESDPMAGILVYTADSDSEGSLGGLVRQGSPDRLVPTLLTALERGAWCSADPVCREVTGQGMQGLNRAACHSCALVSETSCICNNTMLDRMILLGNDEENGDYGFFAEVLLRLTAGVVK